MQNSKNTVVETLRLRIEKCTCYEKLEQYVSAIIGLIAVGTNTESKYAKIYLALTLHGRYVFLS